MRFTVARDHTSSRLPYIFEGLVPPIEISLVNILICLDKLEMTLLCRCRTILVNHGLLSNKYRTRLLNMEALSSRN